MSNKIQKAIVAAILGIPFFGFALGSYYVVEPGTRGVKVTLGSVSEQAVSEGFGFKIPFVTHVTPMSIKQQTHALNAECYSADLQQIGANLKILYRIPENRVVTLSRAYSSDPFQSLIAPRVQEALKEVTALKSAEQIVKGREEIKQAALKAARVKIGDLLVIEDLVIENLLLSKDLENAIEAKMVQEQEAAKARFIQQKTQVEAETQVIKARGEAESIQIAGAAIQQNPRLIELRIIEKWNGVAPLVTASGSGANFLLPLNGSK